MKGKRTLILLCTFLCLCMLLTSCKSSEAESVEELIAAIGEVDDGSLAAIQSAREAYEMLSEKDQKAVSNYSVLQEAEARFDAICAQTVDGLISQIGTIHDDSLKDITAARNAYDQLSKSQKEKVSKYDLLIAAEDEWPEYIVQRTIEVISALDTVDPSDTEAFALAEKLYNSLTDEQKSRVNSSLSNAPNPLQAAMGNRVDRMIDQIRYTRGTPAPEELQQMIDAASAFLELPPEIRDELKNKDKLVQAIKEFVKFTENREKTDKLYARSVFLEKCEKIEFEDLMAYPKSYKGREISVDVQIDEIATGFFAGEIRGHLSGTDHQISLKDNREIKEPAFRVDEIVTVYGVFDGTKTIKVTEDGSGWFGTSLFGKVIEEYEVPVVKIIYASNDNPGVIAQGDPSAKDLALDENKEELIRSLQELAQQILPD